MVAEDGNIVISICNHKTSSTHGAATICVSDEEGQLLDGYLNMRNCLLQNAPSTKGQLLAGYLNTGMRNCLLQNAPSTRISESYRETDDRIKRGIRPFPKIIVFHFRRVPC